MAAAIRGDVERAGTEHGGGDSDELRVAAHTYLLWWLLQMAN